MSNMSGDQSGLPASMPSTHDGKTNFTTFNTYFALLQRIIALEGQVEELTQKTIPVYQRFSIAEPTNTITLSHTVNLTAPMWVVYETLPQKRDTDYTIENNILTWINPVDTTVVGTFEITYYKA